MTKGSVLQDGCFRQLYAAVVATYITLVLTFSTLSSYRGKLSRLHLNRLHNLKCLE